MKFISRLVLLVIFSVGLVYLFYNLQDTHQDPRFPPSCTGYNPSVKPQPKYNIFKLGPFRYLDNYKNPCWRNDEKTVQCLPYFYLAGMPKCATTDLYYKIIQHPEIAPLQKSTGYHWITRHRFREENPGFKYFVNCRQHVVPSIEKLTVLHQRHLSQLYHPMVTGDAGTSTFWDHSYWPLVPGNENCSEPRITNAMMLHHLFPGTRIIVIFRNPTDRLYSDYVYFSKNVSQEEFHDYCKQSIILFKECQKEHGVRYCVHNSSIVNQFKVRIHIGLYSIYMADWLDVFPRHQILPIKLDDYSKNPQNTFTEIFSFLGVASLNQEEMQKISDGVKKNVGTRKQSMGSMKSETRTMLNKFHAPFNKAMAVQMRDETFLWLRE